MLVPTRIIIRNSAKCMKCGDILESLTQIPPKICSCGCLKISGGRVDLFRRDTSSGFSYMELSEYGWDFDNWVYESFDGWSRIAKWICENNFPVNGNWNIEHKVLFKLTWS